MTSRAFVIKFMLCFFIFLLVAAIGLILYFKCATALTQPRRPPPSASVSEIAAQSVGQQRLVRLAFCAHARTQIVWFTSHRSCRRAGLLRRIIRLRRTRRHRRHRQCQRS